VNLPFDLIALREEYFTKGLRRIDLDPDPIKEFGIWFTAAVEVGISEMNAMALATVAENGQPTTRMVLLKGLRPRRVCFLHELSERKGPAPGKKSAGGFGHSLEGAGAANSDRRNH
jgi:pyridoxamine 5'-phosphate oxidase